MKKILAVSLMMFFLMCLGGSFVTVNAASSGTGTGISDAGGNSAVDAIKSFATSGWGKLLFFCALIAGVIGFMSHKYRPYGIIALLFGVLLGVFGPVGESLWTMFTSWGAQ